MLNNVTFAGLAPCPGTVDPEDGTRGQRTHKVSVADLLEFGRSPQRWRYRELDPKERPYDWQDLVRGYFLTPAQAHACFTPRPETYPAMVLACPVCNSVGTGVSCRKCGQRRRKVTKERPWAGTAEYCKNWTGAAEAAGRHVIACDAHERACKAVEQLGKDSTVVNLQTDAVQWQRVEGVYQDVDTGLKIPVRTVIHLAPSPEAVLGDCIGTVYATRDAAPGPWAAQVIRGHLHVAAAWDLDLFNAATGEQRDRVCWCLVEMASPFLVGRREPERDLIQAGRSMVDSLLQAYARCLKADSWPAFDVASENPSNSWSGVAREMWMADVDSRSSAFFGVDASLALGSQ